MPTGYTADIAKGITFEQYALGCARAFGALVMMRDDPADAEIPERFEPSDYHVKAIVEETATLAELRGMAPDEAARGAAEDYQRELQEHRRRKQERLELKNKYNAMLAQVVKWKSPSSDHDQYKEFMISQIRESIDFDCNERYVSEPVQLTGEEWLSKRIENSERMLEYHKRENAKEIERTESRNRWIAQLRESLTNRGE